MFDEPTTGLHFDDIAKLMRALRKLIDAGHSLIVIEHNLDVIRASDWLIDLGPEGGYAGGLLVAEGTPEDVRAHATSHTGQALRDYEFTLGVGGHSMHEKAVVLRKSERLALMDKAPEAKNAIQIVNAKEHNRKNLSVDIPRGKFNVVTGVSGSGKSTLTRDVLLANVQAWVQQRSTKAGRDAMDDAVTQRPSQNRCAGFGDSLLAVFFMVGSKPGRVRGIAIAAFGAVGPCPTGMAENCARGFAQAVRTMHFRD